MKKIFFSLLIFPIVLPAQPMKSVTLKQCEDSAKTHAPLQMQKDYNQQILALNQQNIKAAYYPVLDLNGQATYQSSTIEIPITIPNLEIPDQAKDQYKFTLDMKQLIYDGGYHTAQQIVNASGASTEEQKLEVELYKLKENVNQFYFNILLQNSAIQLTEVMKHDLQNKMLKVNSGIKNGIALGTQADQIQVEILKANQRILEFKASRNTAIQSLAYLTGMKLDTFTSFAVPEITDYSNPLPRPEYSLFDLQDKQILSLQELNKVNRMPKLYAFGQAGVGRPAFNPFDPNFEPFYIVGIKFTWNIWNWNITKNQNQVLAVNQAGIKVQQQLFDQKIQLQQIQQSADIKKLEDLIVLDNSILSLKESIVETAEIQMNSGVLSASDYLSEVNGKSQAQQNLRTHQLQLLFTQINLLTTKGN